jgi:HlyD family secretion protein
LNEREKLKAEEITVQEQLLGKGLVTKQQVLEMKQKQVEIQDQVATLRTQLKQLDAQKFSIDSQPEEADTDRRTRISGLERDLAGMRKELALAETVTSPYDGEVLELKTSAGSTVATAQPVLSIQPDVQNLEVLAYVPSLQAKDIKGGMEVQISPSNIKREEYGFMKGEVVYVADYPATPAALMRNFENEALVQALSRSGPVTEIHAILKKAPGSGGGFAWSTSRGPVTVISSGTICSVQVVTQRQRPIRLLFPYLKETLGLS